MSTRDQILSTAQRMVQQRGFNGFSYADIAAEVGIRKASIHHHFPSKDDLAKVLIENYTTSFENAVKHISASKRKALDKLDAYCDIYLDTLKSDCACLGGMLASECLTLEPSVTRWLKRFFSVNISWLTALLEEGKANRQLSYTGRAEEQANLILSSMQGALLLARATGNPKILKSSTDMLLARFGVKR